MATVSGGKPRRSSSPVENAITTKVASQKKAESTTENVAEKVTAHIEHAAQTDEERTIFMSMLLDWP